MPKETYIVKYYQIIKSPANISHSIKHAIQSKSYNQNIVNGDLLFISTPNRGSTLVEKRPASRASNSSLISYPSTVWTSIREYHCARLQLMDKLKPDIKKVFHVLLTFPLCTVQKNLVNITISVTANPMPKDDMRTFIANSWSIHWNSEKWLFFLKNIIVEKIKLLELSFRYVLMRWKIQHKAWIIEIKPLIVDMVI